MKWLKICALLVLTLGGMRAGSWVLGWALARSTRLSTRFVAMASNAGAFGAFAALLIVTLLPGEPPDIAALVFGFVVFAVYAVTDLYWTPWKRRGHR